ncbi:hypothetical protein DYB32_006193 [Aphanomyces invadans]|uniref:Uncharacterized protein n=1 Tax=Aphanomyces invadans TaxID=157072 RepID=A0A418B528_9STRA|nr:hypothetical protein DYB32_006193 [Aphanomyces invadans]
MSVLEDMVATAQLEAQEKIAAAAVAEERMKVMKWELVRQATTPKTPRQSLQWALNDKTLQKLTKTASTREASAPTSTKPSTSESEAIATPSKVSNENSLPQPTSAVQRAGGVPTQATAAVADPIANKTSLTPKNSTTITQKANESTNVAAVEGSALVESMNPELQRARTPRKIVDPSEVDESKEAFGAAKAMTASSSRRTKDSNAIERGNSNIGTRRHSSKSIIRGAPMGSTSSMRHRDSLDGKAMAESLQKVATQSSLQLDANESATSSSKPKLSPKTSRSSIIVSTSSRETSPTAAKCTPGFVLSMPLSKAGAEDLPPPSTTSPPTSTHQEEPEAEPSTGVTAFALDEDDDDDGAVVCLDETALDDLM